MKRKRQQPIGTVNARLGRMMAAWSKSPDSDHPLLFKHPSLPELVDWASVENSQGYADAQVLRKSHSGALFLIEDAGQVLTALLKAYIDVITITCSPKGLVFVFPYWSWRRLFFNGESLFLKTNLTLSAAADKKTLQTMLNHPDVTFEYYGHDDTANRVFVAKRSGVTEAVLADGRVCFDFSKHIVGFGSYGLDPTQEGGSHGV